MVQNIFNS